MGRISLICAVLIGLAPVALADSHDLRRLSVSGEGRIEAPPDMATVSLGVVTEAKGAREAIDSNAAAMTGVLDRLRGLGIAERDLQTSGYSVEPRWERQSVSSGPPKIAGFVARNMLSLRVRDLELLGVVLDEVARDGANSFGGLRFGLQEPGPVADEARRAAMADARRKAGILAEEGGFGVGRVVTVSEGGGFRPEPMMMQRAEMAMAADAVPVAAGELTTVVTVNVVFEIVD